MSTVDGYKDSGAGPDGRKCRCGCGDWARVAGYSRACYARLYRRVDPTGPRSGGPHLTDSQIAEIRRLRRLFWTDAAIARHLGIRTATVRRHTGRRP